MRKMPIGKSMYDVLTLEEYYRKTALHPAAMAEMQADTAIEHKGYVYPILNPNVSNDSAIGVRDYGAVMQFTRPTTIEDQATYSVNNMIDFQNNPNGMQGMIQKTAELEAAERTVLINKDNVTQFVIQENDTPEFALLKKALNQKAIDMTSYKQRHGSDYSNNYRLLTTSNSITFGKLKAIAAASDIEAELILRDKPGCANPMGEELRTRII